MSCEAFKSVYQKSNFSVEQNFLSSLHSLDGKTKAQISCSVIDNTMPLLLKSSGETIHCGASKTDFSAVGSIHDSHPFWFGLVRSHVQPGGCILLSFIKTNTKSDLICISRSTKSVSV